MLKTPQIALAVFLLVVMSLIGLWDIFMVAFGRENETVSAMLRGWAKVSTFFVFGSGLLMGHIFLCSNGRPEPVSAHKAVKTEIVSRDDCYTEKPVVGAENGP